jgi:hypothetical protein
MQLVTSKFVYIVVACAFIQFRKLDRWGLLCYRPTKQIFLTTCWSISVTRTVKYVKSLRHPHVLCERGQWMLYLERVGGHSGSQWPRGPKRRSAAASLLKLWIRIPPGSWMSVCCDCCVLSGKGFYDELIPRPEESYGLWYVVVCDLETP